MTTAIMSVRKNGRTQAVAWRAASMFWAALFFCGPAVGTAMAGAPTEAMRSMVDEVLRILRDKELKQPEHSKERRRQLHKAVGQRFDFLEMSRRARLRGLSGQDIRLTMSHTDLASFLGMARETLSRAMSRLETDGVIAGRGQTVAIADSDALRSVARG